MARPSELKRKQTEITKKAEQVETAQLAIREAQRIFEQKRNELKALNSELEKMQQEISVSEHALLRYLERKYNLDFDEIINEILLPPLRSQIESLGSGTYPLNRSLRAVVKNKVVVTVTAA